jgi:hypothetical protein
MAYKSGADAAYVIVDGVNIAPAMESLTLKTTAVMDERRFLGSAWKTPIDTGAKTGELAMQGVIDSPTTDTVAALNTTGAVVSALLSGNAVDVSFYGFQAAQVTAIEVGLADGKVDDLTPTFAIAGEVNVGTVVAPWASRAADANTDAAYSTRPSAAAASGHAYLHVTAYTGGATKVVVKLRSSASHITFADIATFADVTAVGAQVLAIPTDVILEHCAIGWAWTGGTNPTFSAFCGVAVD